MSDWNGYPIVELPLRKLFATVGRCEKTISGIFPSILNYGFLNPLLVVVASKDAYEEKCHIYQDLIPNTTDKIHYIYGGSQRYYVACEIGLETIPCVIVDDFDTAWNLQFTQRKGFEHLYG